MESDFDFGQTTQDAKIAHTYYIKSAGDDTLRILKVIPGCGCTQAPLSDSSIAPGDSAALEIFFSTRKYRGNVSKRPYIETNAGEEKYYVRFSADLIPEPDSMIPLRIQPFNLDVSQFTSTPRRKASFQITNVGDRDYAITLIDWSKRHFDVKLPNRIKAGGSIEGIVEVNEDMVDKEFEQSLTFEIDDELNTRYTIPVKRMVRIKDVSASK
jgi:hypothetical protein